MCTTCHEPYSGSVVQALEIAARERGWPPLSLIRYRLHQAEIILERTAIEVHGKRVLEIGGGAAGHGALFADMGATVVSSDLLEPTALHAGLLIDFAHGRSANHHYIAARAEALPIADGSFDMVFSSYVLEHVAAREQAAAEMWRVLRAGGVAVNLVPNVPDGIMSLLRRVTVYEPRQIAKLVLKLTGLDWRIFHRHAQPDLAILPHGEYRSVADELRHSTIANWDRIFTDAGFTISHRSGIAHEGYVGIPSFGLLSWVPLTSWLQHRGLPLLRVLGRGRFGLIVAPGYVFVARKDVPQGEP
jgi:SAM-dependent methyltransferase